MYLYYSVFNRTQMQIRTEADLVGFCFLLLLLSLLRFHYWKASASWWSQTLSASLRLDHGCRISCWVSERSIIVIHNLRLIRCKQRETQISVGWKAWRKYQYTHRRARIWGKGRAERLKQWGSIHKPNSALHIGRDEHKHIEVSCYRFTNN